MDTPESRERDINWWAGFTFDHHRISPKDKKDNILEIGCGMGRFMLMLKENGYQNLTGLDIDQSQIDVAQKENLNVFLSDASDFLMRNNEKYDVIYCFDVLEHIEKDNQLPLLKLIHQHLSDDGFLVLQVPNAMSPTATYFRYIDFTHLVSYTDKTLGFLLHNAGLHFFVIRPQHQETQEIQQLKMPWARLYRHEFCLDSFILTPNIVAVAFKKEQSLNDYLSDAPEIKNDYQEIQIHEAPPKPKERPLKRLWRHLKKGKF
jgi:2-polyprenyl-3-methyl-5-hydroxy-6-metoxy-1,4-benzoquinol methylase